MSGTVTLRHPSTPYRPGGDGPCPTCGRFGGHPEVTHGGEFPHGAPDVSLAGLRCTAEAAVRALTSDGPECDPGEGVALLRFLADTLALLDRAAGGVD